MARIIESIGCGRRMIKLSTADILSVVREYQQNISRHSNYIDTIDKLSDIVIFLPEDV
jgi:hypothetical protein